MRPEKHVSWWPFHWRPRKWKRTELPDEVRSLVTLQSGEHVLSYGLTPDGSAVVATDHGLWLNTGSGMERVDWVRIATIASTRRRLEFTYLTDELADRRVVAVDLTDPGEVVDAAWDQMSDNTVTSVKVPVQGELGVRVVARRGPYSEEVVWGFVPDPGLDVTDEAVRMRAAEALFQLRQDTEL